MPWTVDGVVTTVDAVNGHRQLSAHPESVKQAAVADRLLVTKSDIASERDLAALHARLRAINPGAPILTACHGDIEPAELFELFDAGAVAQGKVPEPDIDLWLGDATTPHARHVHHAGVHDDGVRALSLTAETPIEIHHFVRWIEALLEAHGDRVLRLKGILHVAGDKRPVVVNGVQHVFHPLGRLSAWPASDRRSRLVVIVKDLDVEPIARDFRRVVGGSARMP